VEKVFYGVVGRAVGERVVRGMEKESRRKEQDEKEVKWEEVRNVIKRLKDGKAMRMWGMKYQVKRESMEE